MNRNEEGLFDGQWVGYHPNGKSMYNVTYLNNVEHGLYEYYDNYGKLLYKGNYIMGVEDGLWLEFDELYFYATD